MKIKKVIAMCTILALQSAFAGCNLNLQDDYILEVK